MVRVMFCVGGVQNFFDIAGTADGKRVLEVARALFQSIGDRSDVRILATMDDDQLQVGASSGFPYTAYLIADVDNLEAVIAACNSFKESQIDGSPLTRFLRLDARLGRPLLDDLKA
jgi:hypothetical protein